MRFLASFLVLFLFCLAFPVSGRLLSVVLVSRHGTRAPNPVVAQLCPADKANLDRYESMDISLAGLTGKGMTELYELGVYTKQKYMINQKFLTPAFNNEEIYIRSVGEDRTLQSAAAWGQAVFGPGQAPTNYYRDLPVPLPIYTIPDEMDNLLEVRKAACKNRLKRDVKMYDQTKLVQLYAENAALIEEIAKLCGVDLNEAIVGSGDNLGDAVKDITDAFTFDIIEGFTPLPGLTLDSLLRYRSVAVEQLIGRILGTDEQITYLNGALPQEMRESFLASIQHDPKALKFYSYHGHREMLYAVGKYYGIDFDIDFPGLPKGAIPPATTLFFELHESESAVAGAPPSHTVKVFVWIPCNGNTARQRPNSGTPMHSERAAAHWERSEGLDCPAEQVKLAGCAALDCTWEEFLAIEEERVKRTGTWETLCDYEPEASKLAMITDSASPVQASLPAQGGLSGPLLLGVSAIGFCIVGIAFLWKKKNSHDYSQLP